MRRHRPPHCRRRRRGCYPSRRAAAEAFAPFPVCPAAPPPPPPLEAVAAGVVSVNANASDCGPPRSGGSDVARASALGLCRAVECRSAVAGRAAEAGSPVSSVAHGERENRAGRDDDRRQYRGRTAAAARTGKVAAAAAAAAAAADQCDRHEGIVGRAGPRLYAAAGAERGRAAVAGREAGADRPTGRARSRNGRVQLRRRRTEHGPARGAVDHPGLVQVGLHKQQQV